MHPWILSQLADERQREVRRCVHRAPGSARRRVRGDRRRARSAAPSAPGAVRVRLGWWLVEVGLRLAVAR